MENKIFIIGGQRVDRLGNLKSSKRVFSLSFNAGFIIKKEAKIPVKLERPIIAAGGKHAIIVGGKDPKTEELNKACFYINLKNGQVNVHSIEALSIDLEENYPPTYKKEYAMFISYPNVAVRYKDRCSWAVYHIKDKAGPLRSVLQASILDKKKDEKNKEIEKAKIEEEKQENSEFKRIENAGNNFCSIPLYTTSFINSNDEKVEQSIAPSFQSKNDEKESILSQIKKNKSQVVLNDSISSEEPEKNESKLENKEGNLSIENPHKRVIHEKSLVFDNLKNIPEISISYEKEPNERPSQQSLLLSKVASEDKKIVSSSFSHKMSLDTAKINQIFESKKNPHMAQLLKKLNVLTPQAKVGSLNYLNLDKDINDYKVHSDRYRHRNCSSQSDNLESPRALVENSKKPKKIVEVMNADGRAPKFIVVSSPSISSPSSLDCEEDNPIRKESADTGNSN